MPQMTAALGIEPPLPQDLNGPPRAVRHRLQAERASITHKFSIAGHEGYITVGLYPTGQPGEIFIKMAKEGSTVSGLMDAFATSISLALQHGVPLRVLCEKFAHTRFEPSGWTGNEQIGYAKSLMDYIFRWLNLRFLSGEQLTLFAGLAPQAAPNSRLHRRSCRTLNRKRILQLRSSFPSLAEEMSRLRERDRGMGSTSAPGGSIRTGGTIIDHRFSLIKSRTDIAGPRNVPRLRCNARHVRDGRCTKLLDLRSHHGSQRKLLSLHELRINERLQLDFCTVRTLW